MLRHRSPKLLIFAAVAGAACLLLVVYPSSHAGANVPPAPFPTTNHFGRMFPTLPAFNYSDQASADLAAAMINPMPDPPGVNAGTPDDSKTLASWQTYFGQLLDHNLDIDATPQPTSTVNVNGLVNYTSGVFDMENIFGYGPLINPQMYTTTNLATALKGQFYLKVQCTLGTPNDNGTENVIKGNANGACDLARNADGTEITPFNESTNPLLQNLGSSVAQDDENQIISQMQVPWILFYNNLISAGMNYTTARAETEQYYQLDIATQMLPDFVTDSAYYDQYLTTTATDPAACGTPTAAVLAGGCSYTIKTPNDNGTFMPVEFSVGAYRFGHSLVRNVYHLNEQNPTVGVNNDQVNVPIFDVNNFQTGDLSGGSNLEGPVQSAAGNCEDPTQTSELCSQPVSHQIEWKDFFKTLNCGGASAQALAEAPWCYEPDGTVVPFNPVTSNAARQTSPTISPNLYDLPANAIPGCADVADPVCNGSNSLTSRDLARGNYDGLPSGQAVAAALGCPVIPAAQINALLPELNTANPTDAVFATATPLMVYVEGEAKLANTVLGCTGSDIISQVFLRALVSSHTNTLTLINPASQFLPVTAAGTFNFQDLLVDTKLAPAAS